MAKDVFSMPSRWASTCPAKDGGCGKPWKQEDLISPHPDTSAKNVRTIWIHNECAQIIEDGGSVAPKEKMETAEAGTPTKGKKAASKAGGRAMADIGSIELCVRVFAGVACTILAKWKEMVLSSYQEAVIVKVLTSTQHLILEAGPGCGKSHIGKFLLWCAAVRGVCISFNRSTADALKNSGELPQNISSSTSHSVGMATLNDWYTGGKMEVRNGGWNDKQKKYISPKLDVILWNIWSVRKHLPKDQLDANWARVKLAKEIISKAKACLVDTPEDARALISRYEISTNGCTDEMVNEVLQQVPNILDTCEEQTRAGIIDFDDMIWGVIRLGLKPKSRLLVFVDEAQDFTKCQLQLAMACAGDTGRVILVGDPRQAIYVWRGAAQNGMDDAFETLKATSRGCALLPLLLTYRCPKLHVALCNLIFPQAKNKLEALTTAIDGKIVSVDPLSEDWIGKMTEAGLLGDLLILCRTNAPLIAGALGCLARGQKAVVRGRDFAKSLIKFIKDIQKKAAGTDEVETFLDVLNVYVTGEMVKAEKRGGNCQSLMDKAAGISALAAGCESIGSGRNPADDSLLGKIAMIFDDDETDAVVFSTIHQAKGLEESYIAILKPELMPGPWAETAQQMQEERNIQWVAYSRSKYALIFIDGGPSTGLPEGCYWSKLDDAIDNGPKPEGDGTKADKDEVEAEDKAEREAIQAADGEPVETVKAPEPTPSKPGKSVTLSLFSTIDVRGKERKGGTDAIRIIRKGGKKKEISITKRALGWQYHVTKKANESIRGQLGNVALPKLPTMKRGRPYDSATPEKWSVILDAYRKCGVTITEDQAGYERVFILEAAL